MTRKLALLVAILVIVVAAQTQGAEAHRASGHKSDNGWVCDLSGAIVAAGVGAATAPITGILAGGGWTAGCHVGETPHKPPILFGLPHLPTHCWYEFHWHRHHHHGPWHRQHKRFCYA